MKKLLMLIWAIATIGIYGVGFDIDTGALVLVPPDPTVADNTSDIALKANLTLDNLSAEAAANAGLATTADLALKADADEVQMNSGIIPCDAYTATYTWPATNIAGTIYMLGPTNSWMSETGSVEIACSDAYLVDVLGDIITAPQPVGGIPSVTPPVSTSVTRTSNTSILYQAWCDLGGNGEYWATLTNAVPITYDLAGMTPNSVTNDGAGIIQRADTLPDNGIDVLSDGRLVINAASLKAYIDSRVAEIAKKAWNYTPSGQPVANTDFVTIDEPLIQQGTFSWLQSGDYYAQSYVGGDWWSSAEGSAWYIGPSGSKAFGITSTNKMLNIISFSVSNDVATLDISTNGVAADPEILWAVDLGTKEILAQWIKAPEQTMTDMTSYWRGQCSAADDTGFFRAVSAGGESRVVNKFPAQFEMGVADDADNILDFITVNIGGTNVQVIGRIVL